MNSKTAKLIAKAARHAALATVLRDGRFLPQKNMGEFQKVCNAVCDGFQRNLKASWKRTPWNRRGKKRRQMKHVIMMAEHALHRAGIAT